mmetsp:Transcript_16851/g.38641  ORF Transcript_16851/g.38641 Transcript_16851/m.38641 type:complete len:221 (+) Transcript_16851:1431-2093(+)
MVAGFETLRGRDHVPPHERLERCQSLPLQRRQDQQPKPAVEQRKLPSGPSPAGNLCSGGTRGGVSGSTAIPVAEGSRDRAGRGRRIRNGRRSQAAGSIRTTVPAESCRARGEQPRGPHASGKGREDAGCTKGHKEQRCFQARCGRSHGTSCRRHGGAGAKRGKEQVGSPKRKTATKEEGGSCTKSPGRKAGGGTKGTGRGQQARGPGQARQKDQQDSPTD